jgi:hypothetical protein
MVKIERKGKNPVTVSMIHSNPEEWKCITKKPGWLNQFVPRQFWASKTGLTSGVVPIAQQLGGGRGCTGKRERTHKAAELAAWQRQKPGTISPSALLHHRQTVVFYK